MWRVRFSALAGVALVVVASGCSSEVFFCQDDTDCQSGASAEASCRPNGLCSFPDADCASGERYGEAAGSLAGQCVNPDEVAETETGGTSTSSSSSAGSSPATTLDSTSTSTSTGTSTTSSTLTTDESETTAESSTTTDESTTTTETTGTPGTSALGEACDVDSDCQVGGVCHIEGVCSECSSDDDCEFGCTPPIPAIPGFAYGFCNEGLHGHACSTVDACADADQCTLFTELPASTLSTCSSCDPLLDDCPDGQTCDIVISASFQGAEFACVSASDAPDGSFCHVRDEDMSGSLRRCASECAPVSGPFVSLGVCGECRDDDDCPEGTTCTAGSIDAIGTPTPSRCE